MICSTSCVTRRRCLWRSTGSRAMPAPTLPGWTAGPSPDLHAATERLNTAHMSDAERTGLTVDFATFAALIPPTVVHTGMQLYTGLGLSQRFTPICHGIASTISGPPVPVYCAGAKVVGMHTAAPLVEGCGLNITLISHGDLMDLSVCVCHNVPAVNDIATDIVDSGGGRTRISTRGTPLSPHPDDVTHPEAFARPALTGFDQSTAAARGRGG